MSVYTKAYTQRDGSDFYEYPNMTIEYRDASHRYWGHWDGNRVALVSVTSALKVLDKPQLLPWAEAAGAEGAILLERQGELEGVPPHLAIDMVRANGLGMDAKRDAGADRGTAVHKVLELWSTEETVPNVADFPAEVRGYVQGLCGWLLEYRPKPTSVERCVGSLTHMYAGRMDLRADIDSRDCIVDLKTNKSGRVYDEAHLQARAYAIADVECGSPPPQGIVIVAVGKDGTFEQVDCEAPAKAWLSVLDCYRAMNALRSARAVRRRAKEKS